MIDFTETLRCLFDEVLDTIRILRKKTKYFNYYDKPFYDAFNKRLSDFEDYLIKVYDNRPDQNRIASEMEKRDKHALPAATSISHGCHHSKVCITARILEVFTGVSQAFHFSCPFQVWNT